MEAIFLKILNMSITAGWIVLAVVLLRFLLRKAPKWISCMLWVLVAIRLVLPFSIESVLSLIPSKETIPPEIITSPAPTIHSGIEYFNSTVNPVISDVLAPDPVKGTTPVVTIVGIATLVWIIGILAMFIYSVVSYLRIRKRIKVSIETEKGIFICDSITTPFILGLIKPKIYLPSTISQEDTQYVLAHERAHLKRRDHLIKPFGFLLLSIYWFNPLLWLGYILLCRDIELACDEKVTKGSSIESKKSYSTALLNCSIPRRMISACPLAFGEVGVKKRIKNILNYKKPAFWIIIVALIISIVASVCLLTNPVEDNSDTILFETETITIHNNDYLQYQLLLLDGDPPIPYVRLYPKDNRFEFMLHKLSSYLPMGTYTIDGDKLILECDGEDTNKYVFRLELKDEQADENTDYNDEDTLSKAYLVFLAKESTELPKFKYYANDTEARPPFEDGANFVLTRAELTDRPHDIAFDIDGDGDEEVLNVGFKPTNSSDLEIDENTKYYLIINDNGTTEYVVIPNINRNPERNTLPYVYLKESGESLYLFIEENIGTKTVYGLTYSENKVTTTKTMLEDIADFDIDGDGVTETLSMSNFSIYSKQNSFTITATEYGVFEYINEFVLSQSCDLHFKEKGNKLYVVTTTLDALAFEQSYEVTLKNGSIVLSGDSGEISYNEDGYITATQFNNYEEYSTEHALKHTIDTIVFDIDNDGKNETVIIGDGGTSGVCSFRIIAKENGKIKYNTFFSGEHLDFSFEKGENNTLYLKGIKDEYIHNGILLVEAETHKYKVDVFSSQITLTENGVHYGYDNIHSPQNPLFKKIGDVLYDYAEGYKSHDVTILNNCFTHTFINPDDKDVIEDLVNTVTDCKIKSIKFTETSGKEVKAQVTYELTYNDNYLGVGNRQPGYNLVSAEFTFIEKNGKYLIDSMDLESARQTP